jgi:hypothetical protein
MATVLKPTEGQEIFEKQSELTVTEKATYPWEEWLNGDIWKITEGEDFQTHPLMMERIIRTRATGRKAKVRMRHVANNGNPWGSIVLQRTDITGPSERKAQERKSKREAAKAAKTTAAPAKKTVAKKASPSKRPARKLAAVK